MENEPTVTGCEGAGRLVRQYGAERVWGVVSTFAADSFYQGLTYPEAEQLAHQHAEEPGRSATIVLIVAEVDSATGILDGKERTSAN